VTSKTYKSFLAKHWARIAISLLPLLIALGHATNILSVNLLQTIDYAIYDNKLRLSMPHTIDPRIIIVDVDEKSLAEAGQWPWSRDKLGALTTELFVNQKIAMLGFDLVLAEEDDSSGLFQLKKLSKNELSTNQEFQKQLEILEPKLNFDEQFIASLNKKKVVLSYYFTSDRDARRSGKLPSPIVDFKGIHQTHGRVLSWDGYGSNLDKLADAVPQAGFFNAIADHDGVVRSVPLIALYEGAYYESFALALYRASLGNPEVRPRFTNVGASKSIDYLDLGKAGESSINKTIKADDRGAVLIPYRGLGGPKGGSYQYVSAVDVLKNRLGGIELDGKIVLVGSSAPGLQDLRSTPAGQTYPGVETHANVLSGLLDAKSIFIPDYAKGVEVALLLLVGLLLAFVLPSMPAINALGFSLAMLTVPLAVDMHLFIEHGMVLPLATLIFLSLSTYMLNMSYGYFVESKSKRELTKLFGSYVPPQLVDEMVLEPSNHTMRAVNKELTVMFCDLRGFTQLAENFEPVQLQHMLNDIFGRLTLCIVNQRGTVDKYMGDSVMAFWGAPVAIVNHAELAVQTALEIIQTINQINQEHVAVGLPIIKLGIGINTGQMCVGDMGSFMRRSYTVVGDAVNIASRLEGLTKKYDVFMIAGSTTKLNTPRFDWQVLDEVQLDGKHDLFTVYTLEEARKL
jgi:adenylate cyclase